MINLVTGFLIGVVVTVGALVAVFIALAMLMDEEARNR